MAVPTGIRTSGAPVPVSSGAGTPASDESASGLRRWVRQVRWYVRGVTGADAYDNYLRCHAARGCTDAPMSERQFWRDKYERQERNPEGRCC